MKFFANTAEAEWLTHSLTVLSDCLYNTLLGM